MLTRKFTDSDIISISSGGTETSWTQNIRVSPNGGSVDETINNTEYNITIKYYGTGVTDFFEFKRISDTEIQYNTIQYNTIQTSSCTELDKFEKVSTR